METFNENTAISIQLAKAFRVIYDLNGKWITNREISTQTGISKRTVSAHTVLLLKAGIINQMKVFPEHRFQFNSVAKTRNKVFYERLLQTVDILEASKELV